MKRVISWITVPAVAYVLLCVLMYVFQDKFIYMPEKTLIKAYLPVENVYFDSAAQDRIHAWFVPAGKAKATVLFCHGNAGNLSHRVDTLDLLHQLGYSVLIFDYPGYGLSSGHPGEIGIGAAAKAAWRWLVEEKKSDPNKIIVWGRSLGGVVAARLVIDLADEEQKPVALIVESSFTSLSDLASKLYPWLPVRLLLRADFDVKSEIAEIGVPLLVVHSKDDGIIPFELGKRLYDAAAEPKRFVEIRGGHNGGFLASGRDYLDPVRNFIDAQLQK